MWSLREKYSGLWQAGFKHKCEHVDDPVLGPDNISRILWEKCLKKTLETALPEYETAAWKTEKNIPVVQVMLTFVIQWFRNYGMYT